MIRLWNQLTQPNDAIQLPEYRRRARLLSITLLLFILLSGMGIIARSMISLSYDSIIVTLMLIIAYGLSRTRFYVGSAWIFVSVLYIPPLVAIFNETELSSFNVTTKLIWMILPLLLAYRFLPARQAIALMIVSICGLMTLPFAIPDLTFEMLILSLELIGGISTLMMLSSWLNHWDLIQISRSVEQRNQVEKQLRLLSRAIEQSSNNIMITDKQGKIEYVNPKFVETTGYSFDEVLGQNPRILKSGHTSLESYQQLWKTIHAGNKWQGVFDNKKKNGERY